jgi:hypothetical protein
LHFKLNFVAKAYAAATFLMDYLKTEAPFWKKRHDVAKIDIDSLKIRIDPRSAFALESVQQPVS